MYITFYYRIPCYATIPPDLGQFSYISGWLALSHPAPPPPAVSLCTTSLLPRVPLILSVGLSRSLPLSLSLCLRPKNFQGPNNRVSKNKKKRTSKKRLKSNGFLMIIQVNGATRARTVRQHDLSILRKGASNVCIVTFS